MVIENGELTLLDPPDDEIGFRATYSVFRDQIEALGDPDTVTARWSFDGTTLTFTDVGSCTGSSCSPGGEANPYVVVWGSHPWVRATEKATSIDGVYEFTMTGKEFGDTGSPDLVVENYGKFRWVLDGGRFEMTQKNGASDRWTKGSYVVRDDVVAFTVEDFGGVAPTGSTSGRGSLHVHVEPLPRPAHPRPGRESDLAGALHGQALDPGRLGLNAERDLGEKSSARARQALHGEPAAKGFHAVGEAAQTGAAGWIRAAHPVVGDRHSSRPLDWETSIVKRVARVLRCVRERFRADEVDGGFDCWKEPADRDLNLDGQSSPARELRERRGQAAFRQRGRVDALGEVARARLGAVELGLDLGELGGGVLVGVLARLRKQRRDARESLLGTLAQLLLQRRRCASAASTIRRREAASSRIAPAPRPGGARSRPPCSRRRLPPRREPSSSTASSWTKTATGSPPRDRRHRLPRPGLRAGPADPRRRRSVPPPRASSRAPASGRRARPSSSCSVRVSARLPRSTTRSATTASAQRPRSRSTRTTARQAMTMS